MLLHDTFRHLVVIQQNDLRHGMDHLAAYQSLKINFHNLIFQMINIYFLDQNVHVLAVHIELDTAALAACLEKTLQRISFDLYGNGTFNPLAEHVAGHITFPSQSLCLHIHASLFSF